MIDNRETLKRLIENLIELNEKILELEEEKSKRFYKSLKDNEKTGGKIRFRRYEKI